MSEMDLRTNLTTKTQRHQGDLVEGRESRDEGQKEQEAEGHTKLDMRESRRLDAKGAGEARVDRRGLPRTFRLALYTPNAVDGSALVRSVGPLLAMAKQSREQKETKGTKLELEIVTPHRDPAGRQELSWDWLASCDALFVQRPYVWEHWKMMTTAKQLGLKVWVDWDDDYTAVRDSNRHKAEYSDPRLPEILARIARTADVVTVTTEELRRRVSRWVSESVGGSKGEEGDGARGAARPTEKVRVVPNALHWPMADFPRERVVSWRGGWSHDEDVLSVLPWMEEVVRMPQFSKWHWHFLGEPPWQVKAQLPAERIHTGFGADPFVYMQVFARLCPWVHIVPLADNGFNRAKSNLAWIEATAAGAMVLAPDWEEWRRPGVVHYKDPKHFAMKLRDVMGQFVENPKSEIRNPNVEASRAYINEHLLLEKVNGLRWEILEEFAAE